MTTGSRARPPVPLTSFVGRETATSEVSDLLGAERLVTLTGPGGSGKTRLAERVARVRLPDGRTTSWVELGPLTDAGLLPQRLGHAIGAVERPGKPVLETIEDRLGGEAHLLVLDTCEHLAPAVAELAGRLLRACPGVSVLATSRQPLGVGGEVVWPVPPLSVPSAPTPDAVTASEAGALFVERARRVARDFRLTEDNASAVAEICRRLDGMPLAIELAAARCRVLSPERIARGLDDRFRLLATDDPTGEPRHRSLSASMEWSHALLAAPERALVRALGVFAGSFTLEGAVAVADASGVDPDQCLDLLTALVDRSWVGADTVGTEPRYHLLDTVRAYARDLHQAAGEAEALAASHYEHVAGVVERHAGALLGARSDEAFAAIDDALDDVRQAMDWAGRSGDAERALRLTSALHWYWRVRGPTEGRDRLAAALALGGTDALRCPALVSLASLEMILGEIDRALEHARAARELAESIGDRLSLGRALAFLGWLTIMQERDLTVPTAVLEDAVRVTAETGDAPYEALAHNALGFSVVGLPPGRSLTHAHLERGMALGEALGFRRPCVEGELWRAYLGSVEGDLDGTLRHLDDVLAPELGQWEPLFRAVAGATRGEVLALQGHHDRSRAVLDEALAAATDDHELVGAAHLRLALGLLDYALGDLAGAEAALEQARPVLDRAMVREAARCEELLALVALRRGDRSMAISLAERCPVQARTFPYIRATAPGLQALALAHRGDGDPVTAMDVYHELLEASDEVGHRVGVVDAVEGLAGCLAAIDRCDEAARLVGAVGAMRASFGYARFPVDRPAHDEAVATATAALGTHGFDEEAAAGSNLSWVDAVALVRRGRGTRGRPSHGWHSLTPTEDRVVALVVEGLTNPQIAERMFVSPRTVQSHLRHVFAKLGVATRAELAAQAAARRAAAAGSV